MAIASRLRGYMNRCGADFDEVMHEPTAEMARAAEAAHVPGGRVAKGVLVRAGDEYMVAVIAAPRHVALDRLENWLGRDVTLVDEQATRALFPDCDLGAIPPVGAAYGIETILDDEMLGAEDIYFEGGDHKTLVHVDGANWQRLQRSASHCAISM